MKKRVAITAKLRESILKEYRHKCAICGSAEPHVHHINEDPSDNDPLNLIPLCPNCHLIDLHDPTQPADPRKLALFRQYRDPVILSEQFHPLFTRMRFLLAFPHTGESDAFDEALADLIAFVSELEMGSYYATRIAALLKRPHYFDWLAVQTDGHMTSSATSAQLVLRAAEYHAQVLAAVPSVLDLLVELLRYQPWRQPN